MNPFTGRSSERSQSEPPEYFLEEEDDARAPSFLDEESTAALARKKWLTGILQACKVSTNRKENNNEN